MVLLLEDAKRHPKILDEFGAIPDAELQDWLRRSGLRLPSDLVEFWQRTGGGDVFESETILPPTVPSAPNSAFVDDGIEGTNAATALQENRETFTSFKKVLSCPQSDYPINVLSR